MKTKSNLGLVHVITGDGKGKTTSSIGSAVRALGRGLKVRFIQLFKRDTGEKGNLEKLGVEYFQFKPMHPCFKKHSEKNLEGLRKELLEFWKKSIINLDQVNVLIVDELGPALNWKVMDENFVLSFIKNKPENLELILTGRDFPGSIRKLSDYVSEIKMKKHPYNKGIMARKGIEF